MINFKLFLLLFLITFSSVKGQNLSIFDENLNQELLTLDQVFKKYELYNKKIIYYPYFLENSSSFYTLNDSVFINNISLNRSLAIKNNKLNQISLGATNIASVENFNIFNLYIKNLIFELKKKYDIPQKEIVNKDNFVIDDKNIKLGVLYKYLWHIGNSKLLLSLSVNYDYNNNHKLVFRIIKFDDYYGNIKVPDNFEVDD